MSPRGKLRRFWVLGFGFWIGFWPSEFCFLIQFPPPSTRNPPPICRGALQCARTLPEGTPATARIVDGESSTATVRAFGPPGRIAMRPYVASRLRAFFSPACLLSSLLLQPDVVVVRIQVPLVRQVPVDRVPVHPNAVTVEQRQGRQVLGHGHLELRRRRLELVLRSGCLPPFPRGVDFRQARPRRVRERDGARGHEERDDVDRHRPRVVE